LSLKLKGRKVFLSEDYRSDGKIMHGVIVDVPIYVKVRLESGNVVNIEESKVHFDLKKKGRNR